MDPLTALVTLVNAYSLTITLITEIWKATPDAQKSQSAADMGKTVHNISAFVQGVQDKINVLVVVPKP